MIANYYTAIPDRASTGPEQGFPCVVFPHREKPVFIAGFPVDENRFFSVGNTTQGTVWERVPKEDAANFESDTFL